MLRRSSLPPSLYMLIVPLVIMAALFFALFVFVHYRDTLQAEQQRYFFSTLHQQIKNQLESKFISPSRTLTENQTLVSLILATHATEQNSTPLQSLLNTTASLSGAESITILNRKLQPLATSFSHIPLKQLPTLIPQIKQRYEKRPNDIQPFIVLEKTTHTAFL